MKLDPFPVPDFDTAPALAIIERLPWRTARKFNRWGQRQTVHEYVVRNSRAVAERNAPHNPKAEADYIALFHLIQRHGREERFRRARRQYLYVGDGRKYWAMSEIETSGVLNRMLIIDDLDRMRSEGQIE